jgi:dienelactone hydrolase
VVFSHGVAGHNAVFDCIKAFSETDFTEDLKKFDVPTLILHGDDDQIVPIGASAMLSSKIVKGATLKVYPGAPHDMCSTIKDQVNAELLAFFKLIIAVRWQRSGMWGGYPCPPLLVLRSAASRFVSSWKLSFRLLGRQNVPAL